jgi:hypothetical protein
MFFKTNWPRYVQKTEKISEVTIIFKNQYFLNKKFRPLAVLREIASNSQRLPNLKNIKNMLFG